MSAPAHFGEFILARHHAAPPLAVAIASGATLPGLLTRSRWAHEVPRIALWAWATLALLLPLSASVTVVQLALPDATSQAFSHLVEDFALLTQTSREPPPLPDLADVGARVWTALAAGATIPVVLLIAFAAELARARRRRTEHANVLRLVGTREPALSVTVVRHDTPTVYCLPGRSSEVVVTSGAIRVLSEQQLAAVLEHERAHIAGRHHVVLSAARAFHRVFRKLPLALHGRDEVPLLLEMAADDRALRTSSRDALATALYSLATGQIPSAACAAGGSSALVRMRRILTPQATGHPVYRAVFAVLAAMAALASLVGACCSLLG